VKPSCIAERINYLVSFHGLAGAAEIDKLDLWGNYSIPKDNPYSEDSDLKPEIWALGVRNPWRCSFDSERPSYFMCADVGQVCDAFFFQNILTNSLYI
jgi:hypothetical protein